MNDFDVIFVNGNYDYHLVKNIFIDRNDIRSKLFSPGFPFLDRLEYLPVTKDIYFKKLFLDPNKTTVLFAPHWSGLSLIREEKDNYFYNVISVLNEMNANVVIKLHACSFNKAMSGGIDWHSKLEELARNVNVRVDYDIDDLPALKYSDILISDISSRILNFMLLGKPIIIYFPINIAWDELNLKIIEMMHHGSFIARTPDDLRKILKQLDMRKYFNHRGIQIAKEFFSNYGRATEEVVRLMKRELGC